MNLQIEVDAGQPVAVADVLAAASRDGREIPESWAADIAARINTGLALSTTPAAAAPLVLAHPDDPDAFAA